jgi:DNA-binding transcriptional regulator YhcF (GntR family)
MHPEEIVSNLRVDRGSEVPVDHQIIHQLTKLIQSGQIGLGDELPSPAALAAVTGVGVANAASAYEKLEENQVLEKLPSGSWSVSRVQDVITKGRRDAAVKLLEQAIQALEELKLSSREISALFQIILMKREQEYESFQIALVDCNPEALAIFESQLRYMTHNRLFRYLLGDLQRDPALARQLEAYDLVVTTESHVAEIKGLCPAISNRLMTVTISPSQQTILDLSSLPRNAAIAVICQSEEFQRIIRRRLASFGIDTANLVFADEDAPGDLAKFLKDRDILILPRESHFEARAEYLAILDAFVDRGGRIQRLDYQIERGSLAAIEEAISDILNQTMM